MSWDYRVIEFVDPSGDLWRGIFEVFYDERGRPRQYSENPACVQSSDSDGNEKALEWVLDRMREALEKPVLVEQNFEAALKNGDSAPQAVDSIKT